MLTSKNFYNSNTIGELIDNAAQRFPDRILFDSPDGCYTALELSKNSTKLAKILRKWKVFNGNVFVISPNSIYHPLVAYACAKNSLAYCCCEETVPSSYWKDMITDFHVKVLVFHPMHLQKMLELKTVHKNIILICLDTLSSANELAGQTPTKDILKAFRDSKLGFSMASLMKANFNDDLIELPPVSSTSPVVLSFTSGTSGGGIYKAVTFTHENLLYITPPPPLFDKEVKRIDSLGWSWFTGVRVLFSTVSQGQTHLIRHSHLGTMSYIDQHIYYKTEKFTTNNRRLFEICYSTPEQIRELKKHCKAIVYTGEKASRKLIMDAIKVLCPEISLIQYYGATETSAMGCMLSAEDHNAALTNPTEKNLKRLESVGKPELGVKVRVINEEGTDCAPGEKGSIIFRTPSMTPGYYNNPEKNSSLFINGWINIGDVGSLDEDGYLYVYGRKNEDEIYTGHTRLNAVHLQNSVALVDGVQESVAAVARINGLATLVLFVAEEPNCRFSKDEMKARIITQVNADFSKGNRPERIYILSSFPVSKISEKVLKHVLIKDLELGKDIESIKYN
ncbi:hypothetical protein BC833DRAFT_624972 [Globomyces pollinis-pini]|nr:hypothetical protein BC833DRAFT_624972 [Globomyces pollinis-pini]